MKRLVTAVVLGCVVLAPALAHGAGQRVVASGAAPVSWVDDGCWIHVHRETRRRPQDELHVQCTINTGSEGEGVVLKYRYPERGVPTSFGALIEEDGHGRLGDLPYLSAWQDPEHPRIGYVHVPGPHADRPNGTYVHVMFVVWNGKLHDEVEEISLPPYG